MRILFVLFFALLSITGYSQPREVVNFNGEWEFKRTPSHTDPKIEDEEWSSVTLPHTWNNIDMQRECNSFYEGDACYRKSFTPSAEDKQKRFFVKFEGVGQVSELFVNNNFVGRHKGGYSAFAFDISKQLKFGEENQILVKVSNLSRKDVIPINHVLFGVYGGIYRPVSLIVTNPIHISVTDYASSGVYITQKNITGRSVDINIKVKLENKNKQPEYITLQTEIQDHKGVVKSKTSKEFKLTPLGVTIVNNKSKLKKPHLWHGRKDPYLYRVVTRIIQGENILDEVIQPLGIRDYKLVAGDGFYLNGEKYPMYGVCRHQDWWELGSALENKHHAHDLSEIMDLGATTIRFAHYQQSEYLYSKCDSLGLIIWAEIPFVNRVSTEEGDNAKSQLTELIRQNFNHPSIYVWGLHNEVYSPSDYTATLTKELHDLAKLEDPDRYTVSVSGYGHMNHPVNMNADIQGMNRYFGWYEKKLQDKKPWIEKLEKEYPEHLFILSEYGADANIDQQTEYLGESLNWTKPFYPETFQTKTHELHWSIIKDHPYILASYLWNSFDFATPMTNRGNVPARNMKGLITFDRKIKKDSYYFYKASWSEDTVLHITQKRLKHREKMHTSITVYSNKGIPSVKLNGVELPKPTQGYTDVHYIFENVVLQKGTNNIEASVAELQDKAEWIYTIERKAGEAEVLNNDETHWGF